MDSEPGAPLASTPINASGRQDTHDNWNNAAAARSTSRAFSVEGGRHFTTGVSGLPDDEDRSASGTAGSATRAGNVAEQHNIAALLQQACAQGLDRLDAELLLARATGLTRAALRAHGEQQADAGARAQFEAECARRRSGEPLAYIEGHKEFWSLPLQVSPAVLVPRPETELLVERCLALLPAGSQRVADLGTGSGALLIAALKEFPRAAGLGLDSSAEALGYARRNVFAHGFSERAKLKLDDWAAAPDDSFDLVFSNPPYIPSAEIESLEPEVLRFEPRAALDGGADGLDAYRALALVLPRMLKKGGRAILEIGAGQAVEPIFQGSGLRLAGVTPDLAGIPRAVLLEKA